MNGKSNLLNEFTNIYHQQILFQEKILKSEGENISLLPQDLSEHFTYHVVALIEEMGEILSADKRWKTHRNKSYVPEEKLEEYADLFITVMNIGIFSGYLSDQIIDAVSDKIKKNNDRLNSEGEN